MIIIIAVTNYRETGKKPGSKRETTNTPDDGKTLSLVQSRAHGLQHYMCIKLAILQLTYA